MNFGERMFLFCGHGNPPGTSSCDKAQVIAAARSERSGSHPPGRRAREAAARRPALPRSPADPYSTVLWLENFLNTAGSAKGKVLAT